MKRICARDPRQQNKDSSYFSFSSRDARVIFFEIFTKNTDFEHFFNSCPVVLSNAAPDRPDTAHPQRAPDAHYTRPGQAGLRRTVQKILNYYWFFGKGWTRFVLPTVFYRVGHVFRLRPEWYFQHISNTYYQYE